MKDRDANRHPGAWRVMQVDSEFAGILVGAGFLVMGLVSMPIATWFFLGALLLGGSVALLLRFRKEKKTTSVIFPPTSR
jgi:LPXTG-motif cell wall-anchored protein